MFVSMLLGFRIHLTIQKKHRMETFTHLKFPTVSPTAVLHPACVFSIQLCPHRGNSLAIRLFKQMCVWSHITTSALYNRVQSLALSLESHDKLWAWKKSMLLVALLVTVETFYSESYNILQIVCLEVIEHPGMSFIHNIIRNVWKEVLTRHFFCVCTLQ